MLAVLPQLLVCLIFSLPGVEFEESFLRHRDKTPTALFFKYNTQLGPPYQVLLDTNFINFTIKNKVMLSLSCFDANCNDASSRACGIHMQGQI